ncbi:conserved hypothetical protein [Theileria equi strain WA]|uniref:Transcription elongation factor 1 homolog n=1 Tax=Theileria equi strain WA TaxID=1537102 RepID=L1LB85_THEEQ|nr:conserved hypothetical protein [Theileria equi strain WA]EKX72697.1 conserved hypothetical protein [Theileria equi strain WA]|eukprot:XP_004832149.1 conserved hypothetical protein [Theileria equi strain WA]
MGKRKTKKIKPSNASVALKRRGKLDKEFHCHFCQHDRAISIKIDTHFFVGILNCRVCGVNFSTKVTSLDEPIDVYSLWMDKCRETDATISSQPSKDKSASATSPASLESSVQRSKVRRVIDVKETPEAVERESEKPKPVQVPREDPDHRIRILNHSRKTIRDIDELAESQVLPISRPKGSQRIIGADETADGAEASLDVRVHNLFDEDD